MVEKSITRKNLEPQPGSLIAGRYEIDRLLARGGVGVVYVARERATGREVVVKVLAAHLTGESEARARFDREVERLSSMQHANIVEVLDHGYEGGAPYLVMEYLSGESLLGYLNRKGTLTLAEFVPIAAQILKALGYAHTQGMMHRDIKPGNIMLIVRKGRANFVKLLDFGMAKLVEGERDITSEQILGTANYMAPEQVRGEPLDARCDVYACGLLFYRMLCGRLPFVADNNAALLYKHVHEIPAPLESLMPPEHDSPPDLLALIDRCLAKDPAERPADANAMTEELLACVPAQFFRLPVADGTEVTSATSMTDATAEVSGTMGPEGSSDSLRRTSRRPKMRTQLGLRPPRPSIAVTGPQVALTPELTPQPAPPAPKPPIVPLALAGGGVLIVLLLILFSSGGVDEEVAPKGVSAFEERRVVASLDHVDALILDGEFPKAQKEIDAVRELLNQLPQHAARAALQERRIASLVSVSLGRKLEASGDKVGARQAFTDALAQDPGNEEARAGLVRVSDAGATQVVVPVTPEDDSKTRPKTRPKDPPKKDEKKDTKTGKSGETFKLPEKKNDPIFLPTGK